MHGESLILDDLQPVKPHLRSHQATRRTRRTRRQAIGSKTLQHMICRRVRQVRRVYLEFLPPPGAHTFFAARLQVCA